MPVHRSRNPSAIMLGALLVGCGQSEPERVGGPDHLNRAAEATPLKAPPPMIVRTPSYRCDDGGPLYVSVMSDDASVTVRDRIDAIPSQLVRNPATNRYEGGGRTLSGTGATVRYSTPERPEQECREAASQGAGTN